MEGMYDQIEDEVKTEYENNDEYWEAAYQTRIKKEEKARERSNRSLTGKVTNAVKKTAEIISKLFNFMMNLVNTASEGEFSSMMTLCVIAMVLLVLRGQWLGILALLR